MAERVLGSDAARAVGRFYPGGPMGYRAATRPDAPIRDTREAAEADEADWLERWRPLRDRYPEIVALGATQEAGNG